MGIQRDLIFVEDWHLSVLNKAYNEHLRQQTKGEIKQKKVQLSFPSQTKYSSNVSIAVDKDEIQNKVKENCTLYHSREGMDKIRNVLCDHNHLPKFFVTTFIYAL